MMWTSDFENRFKSFPLTTSLCGYAIDLGVIFIIPGCYAKYSFIQSELTLRAEKRTLILWCCPRIGTGTSMLIARHQPIGLLRPT